MQEKNFLYKGKQLDKQGNADHRQQRSDECNLGHDSGVALAVSVRLCHDTFQSTTGIESDKDVCTRVAERISQLCGGVQVGIISEIAPIIRAKPVFLLLTST